MLLKKHIYKRSKQYAKCESSRFQLILNFFNEMTEKTSILIFYMALYLALKFMSDIVVTMPEKSKNVVILQLKLKV